MFRKQQELQRIKEEEEAERQRRAEEEEELKRIRREEEKEKERELKRIQDEEERKKKEVMSAVINLVPPILTKLIFALICIIFCLFLLQSTFQVLFGS